MAERKDGGLGGRSSGRRAAWLWLGAVLGGTALGQVGIGPFAWLATWVAVTTGRLLGADVLFLVAILILPSVWILFTPARGTDQAGEGNPARWALVLFGLAGAALALAAVSALLAWRAPGGREPAVALGPGGLAEAAAARRRVTIAGAPDPRARAEFVQPSKQSSTLWSYTGFHPGATRSGLAAADGEAGPVALFVERGGRAGASTMRSVPPEQEMVEGYPVENGLPDHARIVLEQAGVPIATPHYLLDTAEEGLRERHYTPLFLGLFFGFAFAVLGLAVMVRGRRAR